MMKFLVVNNTLPTIFLKSLSPTSTSFVLFNKDFHQLVSPLFFFSISRVRFPSQRTFTNQLLCRPSTEAWSTSPLWPLHSSYIPFAKKSILQSENTPLSSDKVSANTASSVPKTSKFQSGHIVVKMVLSN